MFRERVALRIFQTHLDALIGQRKKVPPGDAYFYRPNSSNSDDDKENDDNRINAQNT